MRGITAKKLRTLTGFTPSAERTYELRYVTREIPVPISENYPRGMASVRIGRVVLAEGEAKAKYKKMKAAFRADKPNVLMLLRVFNV